MQINLQTPHINIADKTREMVLTKLAKLEKIYDRIEQCHVVLKKEKDAKQDYFVAELKSGLSGSTSSESYTSVVVVRPDIENGIVVYSHESKRTSSFSIVKCLVKKIG